ncbi:M15 family metallopeptidase [Paenibacillus lutrae]|uniref:D-alanyl-D-alanine carboxypeptidase family protein n=1 Tax=Paenibacillus lutrae TaxID=2078573 RepID=A0A7X3FGD2_9BACL|nr:M15 family metallopeptidase [Paenibacillus lutrae]MVO98906.1 D-alanyl-D-alanine carboxypeptidase family protein [Paenibacillus lutrae]
MKSGKIMVRTLLLTAAIALFAGCSDNKETGGTASSTNPSATPDTTATASPTPSPSSSPSDKPSTSPSESGKPAATASPKATAPAAGGGSSPASADPQSVSVLVNKEYKLPDNYKPADLTYPDVPFLFKEKIEKRMMRQEAAGALEKMFAGAKKDGINLAGVSAYRSHATQTTLFNRYVQKDGEEAAKKYSAVPGHSEHETGLSIDISGSTGACAADDCFAGTPEAKWLADNAQNYGFIVRYPKGKENITGYQYEPWHMRYVGTKIAKEIHSKNTTMEEYFNSTAVSN